MDNETITKEDIEFNTAFENIPEEVEDFMWSDAYNIIIDSIQQSLGLTDQQKQRVRIASYELLLNRKTMVDIAQDFSKDIQPELTAKILYAIENEILNRAINLTEFYTDETEIPERVSFEKKPSDFFSHINQSLTTPTTIAPLKKTYDSNGPVVTQPSKTPDTKPAIDPYREIPEK